MNHDNVADIVSRLRAAASPRGEAQIPPFSIGYGLTTIQGQYTLAIRLRQQEDRGDVA